MSEAAGMAFRMGSCIRRWAITATRRSTVIPAAAKRTIGGIQNPTIRSSAQVILSAPAVTMMDGGKP